MIASQWLPAGDLLPAMGWIGGAIVLTGLGHRLATRLQLSRAKHPSLRGHARLAQRIAKLVPFYQFGDDEFFRCDGAPPVVEQQRREAFARLGDELRAAAPISLHASQALELGISDAAFVARYRVPFQFRERVRRELPLGCVAAVSDDRRIRDLDGNWSIDVTGAYGCNLFGHDFYKQCIARAVERAGALGMVLGPFHPVIADNVRRLRAISGLDEVSFHMSGTEAVMQAVRLARYHTGRSHVVRFCGAYHGWWDGVQTGVGNPRPPREVYTLADLSERSLAVLRRRRDIACVLVNPLQAMHPNGNAPSDSMLLTGERTVHFDKQAYTAWLQRLREVCTARGIVLILDEVFLGFRLALGGAQQYFGMRADLVTYGKTLGGGLPVGVVCGKAALMRRFREDRPTDVCFARGTFNAHPYVMAAMHEFLQFLDTAAAVQSYRDLDARWDARAKRLNTALQMRSLPVRVANLTSVWTTLFPQPSRYHWLFQYYLRRAGIAPSWVGTGRFIFPNNLSDAEFDEFAVRFTTAAERMQADGWWWTSPGLTAAAIRRCVLRETVAALLFGRRRLDPDRRGGAPGLNGDATVSASPSSDPAARHATT